MLFISFSCHRITQGEFALNSTTQKKDGALYEEIGEEVKKSE